MMWKYTALCGGNSTDWNCDMPWSEEWDTQLFEFYSSWSEMAFSTIAWTEVTSSHWVGGMAVSTNWNEQNY